MAKPKKSEEPMTGLAEKVETHIVKTEIDTKTLRRIRSMVGLRGISILAWLRELAVKDLEAWERSQR